MGFNIVSNSISLNKNFESDLPNFSKTMRKNTETDWLPGALCLIDDNNIITVYGGPLVSSCETGQALHWTNQYISHRTAAKSLHITTMGEGGGSLQF